VARGIDYSILFQNGSKKARCPRRPAKNIIGEKEDEKVVGYEDKQDSALKVSTFLFSSPGKFPD
jgi:hypothetical protein